MGTGIALVLSLHFCSPLRSWFGNLWLIPPGFSSLPTFHLSLPVLPTHAPHMLLFIPLLSPPITLPDSPQIRVIYFFFCDIMFVCTYTIILAMAFFFFLKRTSDYFYVQTVQQCMLSPVGWPILQLLPFPA